jgi:hypothetical protein
MTEVKLTKATLVFIRGNVRKGAFRNVIDFAVMSPVIEAFMEPNKSSTAVEVF